MADVIKAQKLAAARKRLKEYQQKGQSKSGKKPKDSRENEQKIVSSGNVTPAESMASSTHSNFENIPAPSDNFSDYFNAVSPPESNNEVLRSYFGAVSADAEHTLGAFSRNKSHAVTGSANFVAQADFIGVSNSASLEGFANFRGPGGADNFAGDGSSTLNFISPANFQGSLATNIDTGSVNVSTTLGGPDNSAGLIGTDSNSQKNSASLVDPTSLEASFATINFGAPGSLIGDGCGGLVGTDDFSVDSTNLGDSAGTNLGGSGSLTGTDRKNSPSMQLTNLEGSENLVDFTNSATGNNSSSLIGSGGLRNSPALEGSTNFSESVGLTTLGSSTKVEASNSLVASANLATGVNSGSLDGLKNVPGPENLGPESSADLDNVEAPTSLAAGDNSAGLVKGSTGVVCSEGLGVQGGIGGEGSGLEENQKAQRSNAESLRQLSSQLSSLVGNAEEASSAGASGLERRNQELAGRLEEERLRSEQLSLQVREYQMRIGQLEAEARQLRTETAAKISQEVGPLREQLQYHAQTVGILVGEKTELSAALHQAQAAHKQKTADCEELQGRLKASRHRVSDLEKDSSLLALNLKASRDSLDQFQRELELSRLESTRSKEQLLDSSEECLELREKLDAKIAECLTLQQQFQDKTSQLSLNQLKLQQLTSGDSLQTLSELETLTQEKISLELQISELAQTVQTLTTERDQASQQYQQYVQKLNAQVQTLADKLQEETAKSENLSAREQSLIKHISDLEKHLQQMGEKQNGARPELEGELKRLQAALCELQNNKTEAESKYNDELEKRNELEVQIHGLEDFIEELKGENERLKDQPDASKLLAAMESDKVAASRAVEQNKKLKEQLEELHEGFIKMSNNKLELTEKLQHEQHQNSQFSEQLSQSTSTVDHLHSVISMKDKELMDLQKQILHQTQLADRLRHYEAQGNSSDYLQLELQQTKTLVEKLRAENQNLNLQLSKNSPLDSFDTNGSLKMEGQSLNGPGNYLDRLQAEFEKSRQLVEKLRTENENLRRGIPGVALEEAAETFGAPEGFKGDEQSHKELEGLKDLVQKLREENEKLHQEVVEASGSQQKPGEGFSGPQNSVAVLQKELEYSRKLIEKLQPENENLLRKNTEVAKIREGSGSFPDFNRDEKSPKEKELMDLVQKLQEENEKLRQEALKASGEASGSLQKSAQDSSGPLDALQKELENNKSVMENLRMENEKLQKEKEKFQRQIPDNSSGETVDSRESSGGFWSFRGLRKEQQSPKDKELHDLVHKLCLENEKLRREISEASGSREASGSFLKSEQDSNGPQNAVKVLQKELEDSRKLVEKLRGENEKLSREAKEASGKGLSTQGTPESLENLRRDGLGFSGAESIFEIVQKELKDSRSLVEKLRAEKDNVQSAEAQESSGSFEKGRRSPQCLNVSENFLNLLQKKLEDTGSLVEKLQVENENFRRSFGKIEASGDSATFLRGQEEGGRSEDAAGNLRKQISPGTEDSQDTDGPANFHPGGVLAREEAMRQLEWRFKRTMQEVATLTEEKQRLEHLVLQLQGETETIGEYVALYQCQRAILKEKALEKDEQLRRLAHDREEMQIKLEELNALVEHLVSPSVTHQDKISKPLQENGAVVETGEENHTENFGTAGRIIALLSEIKTSNLVQPGDVQNFHPCPWCSGQLITV